MEYPIGTIIRRLRTEKGLTQEALAEMLSISGQSVSKWENGQALPDIQHLPPLAKIFGVTIDTLFGNNPNLDDGPRRAAGQTHAEIAAAQGLDTILAQPEIDLLFGGTSQKALGRRVLVADDAAFMRQAQAQMLEEAGFTLAGQAANGYEAVEAAESLGPDIIVMDIVMPGMDGIDAARRILAARPACVILACSALAYAPVVQRAKEKGLAGFLAKPFLPEVFKARLEALV